MSERKILYSPGFGAGWTTWHGDKAQKLFMLEYAPFIAYLESGGRKIGQNIELMQRFHRDWDAAFPDEAGEYPYEGGLDKLTVMSIPEGARVRIDEYDGSESVEVEGESDVWL